MPCHADAAATDHSSPSPADARPAGYEPTFEELRAVAQELMRGRVIIKNRSFVLRASVPEGLPVSAYYIADVEAVTLADLPGHIRTLRETRGEARGITPADRHMYELLRDNGITGEKLQSPHERRLSVIPGNYLPVMVRVLLDRRRKQALRTAKYAGATATVGAATAGAAAAAAADESGDDEPSTTDAAKAEVAAAAALAAAAENGDDADIAAPDAAPITDLNAWLAHPAIPFLDRIAIVGPAIGGEKEDPAYIVTLGEATLKSKMHLLAMTNALISRMQEVLGPHWAISRRGDCALHIYPVRTDATAKASVLEARAANPIDLATLALIPGIAKVYDPTRVPARVTEQRAILAKLEVERAARKAAGLPEDPEYDPEDPQGSAARGAECLIDSHGRPVRFPSMYRHHMSHVVVASEEKRVKHRIIWGEVAADGAGGLPQQHQNKVLCLMSGGIDSPVAAFQMMNRGCRVDCVHFLNSTSDTAAILAKLTMIAKRLSRIQGRLDLRIVDICELQNAIIGAVSRTDRTVVYKMYMLLISAAIQNYELLITGDSVSQVASQTISNVSTLYPLTPRAIVSPLAGSNKADVILTSRRVGLFELSSMEGADCCQYLMCKTGASLCIGAGKMRAYLSSITGIGALPVKVLAFDNGEAVPGATYTEYIPFENVRASVAVSVGENLGQAIRDVVPRSVTRRHEWIAKNGQEQVAAADDDDGAATDDAKPADAATNLQDAIAASVAKAEKRKKQPVYMDSAAATIIDPHVQEAIARAPVGNPNSLHTVGRICRAAVEGVRHQLISYLCPSLATPFKLAFTSGGTEANNIGIRGLVSLLRNGGDDAAGKPSVLLYSCVSHPSVTEVAKMLAARGNVAVAEAIPVRADGHLDHAVLEAQLAKYSAFKDGGVSFADGRGTRQEDSQPWANVVVAVDLVNHELGTRRDGAAIAKLCRTYGALVHVDACQALCKVDVDATLYDAVSVTAHKINGPTGVGAVAIRAKLVVATMEFVMEGGSFDGGVRPGTLNAPGIVGFGAALSLNRNEEHAAGVFEQLLASVEAMGPQVVRINGTPRLSSGRILHMTLVGASAALAKMDDAEIVGFFATRHNVMLSTGAACSQHKSGTDSAASNLYTRLGVAAGPTLRVSIDHNTTSADVKRFVVALEELLSKIR